MVNEQVEPQDELEDAVDPSVEGDTEVEAEPAPEPEVDLAQLQQQVAELQQRDSAIQDLNRSVGRIQSMMAKLEARPDDSGLRQELQEQFGLVDNLTDILASFDETVMAPEVRQRVDSLKQALSQRKTKAERDSLLQEAVAELQKRQPQQAPQQEQGVSPFEQRILASIATVGLDPDDEHFDWQKANDILRTEGAQGVEAYFRTQIREALTSESAAQRRQARKTNAGSGTPRPAGAGNALDADRQRLQEQGIPIADEAARKRVAEALGVPL